MFSSQFSVPSCASQGSSRCTWFLLASILSILGTKVMWLVSGKVWKHYVSKGMHTSPLHDDPLLLLVLSCFCKLHGPSSPVELVWNWFRHAKGHDKVINVWQAVDDWLDFQSVFVQFLCLCMWSLVHQFVCGDIRLCAFGSCECENLFLPLACLHLLLSAPEVRSVNEGAQAPATQ